MRAALAWIVAALVTWLAFEHAEQMELKLLAVVTPFILYLAVLRSRIHRLEDQLAARESERTRGQSVLPSQPDHAAPAPRIAKPAARSAVSRAEVTQEQD